MNYTKSADQAQALVQHLTQQGGRALAVQGNVSRQADVTALFERAVAEFGRLDVLVNNAGIFPAGIPLEHITDEHFGGLPGGGAYDTDKIVAAVAEMGVQLVIPSKKNRRVQRPIDPNLYRDRNKVEWFCNRPKQFRRLATRYEKTARCFLAMAHFVSALLWLP